MVCHSELSAVDRETRFLVKFSDLIEANVRFSLFERLLNLRLSEGYLVLCQIDRAFRFSEIRTLICKGKFLGWSLGGSGEEEDQAESCIDLIRWLTASSISTVDFKLTFRLIWLSSNDLNLSQSIWPWIRLGLAGL